MKIRFAIFGALAVVLFASTRAPALTVRIQLDRSNFESQTRIFRIETKKATGGLVQYGVTVQPKDLGDAVQGKLSALMLATLTVSRGEKAVATVPVAGDRENGKMTYWFRVDPSRVAGSEFEIAECVAMPMKDDHGRPLRDELGNIRIIGLPGSVQYWFKLQDFAATP